MRVKTFAATSIEDAIAAVRRDLGLDAAILSTESDGPGAAVRVVAAIEQTDPEEVFVDHLIFPARGKPGRAHLGATIAEALDRTGAPPGLAGRLIALARASTASDPVLALAAALDERFVFSPAGTAANKPIALIGPAGAGKTVTIAKLAARAVLADRSVGLITADTARAGGVEQLAAHARTLQLELAAVEDGPGLAAALRLTADRDLRLIDTTGLNPLDEDELCRLAEILHAAKAEPVLVLPSGLCPQDAAELAWIAAAMGARRLIATRLDAARRHASLLAAADAADLALAEFGLAPEILEGLAPATPMALARLVLHDPPCAQDRVRTSGEIQ